MKGFFQIETAVDLFEKLRREHQRLNESPGTDNIFNFFVTAHHIKDYLENDGQLAAADIRKLFMEEDLIHCANLCNKSKHSVLTLGEFKTRPDPVAQIESGALGTSAIGIHAIGGSPPLAIYYPDTGASIEVLPLADRVLRRIADFMSTKLPIK